MYRLISLLFIDMFFELAVIVTGTFIAKFIDIDIGYFYRSTVQALSIVKILTISIFLSAYGKYALIF